MKVFIIEIIDERPRHSKQKTLCKQNRCDHVAMFSNYASHSSCSFLMPLHRQKLLIASRLEQSKSFFKVRETFASLAFNTLMDAILEISYLLSRQQYYRCYEALSIPNESVWVFLCSMFKLSRLCTVQAEHPLFFYWTEDATAEMDSFQQNGYKCSRRTCYKGTCLCDSQPFRKGRPRVDNDWLHNCRTA